MKIFRLIYNEFVKQFKKPSIKIIYALILISAIVIPMVIGKIEPNDYSYFNEESLKSNILYIEENLKELENEKSQKSRMQKKYEQIDKDFNELLLENKIGSNEWRMEEAENYKFACYKLASIELVLNDFVQEVVMPNLVGQDPEEVQGYYKLSKAKLKEIESETIKEKEELLNIIKTGDYQRHTKLTIDRINGYIADEEKTIKDYEELKAKNPTSKAKKAELKKLEEAKNQALVRIPELKSELSIVEFRNKEDIDYSKDNWKNNAILEIEDILMDYRIKPSTEEEFNLDYERSLSTSYEEYMAGFEKANMLRLEKMKEIGYSLENDIPQLGVVKDARSIIDATYEIYIILAVVMVIIIGGAIVSSEFSTGSIRLLLIRPVSRWKILLAKLVSVLIIGYSIVILGTTILSVTSGVIFGFDTLKVPVLQTVSNQIIEVPYFKYMMPQLLTSSSSLILIASLVLMISTLSRNTALSVAIGMLVYIGVAPLTQILISLKQTWLLNTLLPYINVSYFKLTSNMSSMLSEAGLAFNHQDGAVQLLVASAVVLVITFVTFIKRDINN